eukprot:1069018-Pyramimonas_sp.AAC.1
MPPEPAKQMLTEPPLNRPPTWRIGARAGTSPLSRCTRTPSTTRLTVAATSPPEGLPSDRSTARAEAD